jgi:D-arabinose 1-dehydrogenase-like Zn-dependent alcohol dehydrogenase
VRPHRITRSQSAAPDIPKIEIVGIVADAEVISMADINTAFERMLRMDVKYRFVIDMASLH